MKALVTGANGLLGSNIVRELENRKIPVRAMVREDANIRSLHGCSPDFFFGNITSAAEVNKSTFSRFNI